MTTTSLDQPQTTGETSTSPAAPPDRNEEARQAARQVYREALANGTKLIGRDLAEQFDMSERWGRLRIQEVDEERATGDADTVVPFTGRASTPPATPKPTPPPTPPTRKTSSTDANAPTATPVSSTPRPRSKRPFLQAPWWVRAITATAVGAVALVAAVVSYAHMYTVAVAAGEGWRALLWGLSVDGLIVAASMHLLVSRRHGERGTALAWSALVLGIGASLAANIAAADPTVSGRLVAAWPPLALLFAYELLMQLVRPTQERK